MVSQNGVTGIMEPSLYTAIGDVALACAVIAEKARETSSTVLIVFPYCLYHIHMLINFKYLF